MGTMTFGNQNTREEGVAQLNTAFDDYGINFLDTAELYPVPPNKESCGDTDRIVAEFLKGRNRHDVIVATKVCGRAPHINWMSRAQPETPAQLNKEQILHSVDASLERLGGIDHIDLLQLHWPDRYTGGLFGQPDFTSSQFQEDYNAFEDILSALQQVVDEGKVRYIGVSNETPFGVCSMADLAKNHPTLYPKIVSIQNSYSLVVRKDFEAGLAESCYHHKVGLLSYSPLAAGSLSGKYRKPDEVSDNARLKKFPGFMDRYLGSVNEAAVNAYATLAEDINMTPTQLALSWCYHREHVASTIIGATTMDQLHENIQSYDIRLDDEAMDKIGEIYKQYTDPTKARN